MCRRCYTEKTEPKKFSAENNMDPGEIPNELKGLTEIEEMLIAQVFSVMTVYRLRGGQSKKSTDLLFYNLCADFWRNFNKKFMQVIHNDYNDSIYQVPQPFYRGSGKTFKRR
jgi:hypothetical protein